MAAYFLDTSAIVKRWVRESGSAWVRRITARRSGHRVFVARLLVAEVASALARRQRAGDVDVQRVARAMAGLRMDIARRFRVVELTAAVIDRAADLARAHPLRGADAVHLAAACTVHDAAVAAGGEPLVFLAPDDRLRRAAAAEGLAVDDPEAHDEA